MNTLAKKINDRSRRKNRVRATVSGSSDRPRLSVHISNMHITAQIVDDTSSKTLAYATTIGQKTSGTLTEKAAIIGAEIAKKAKTAKVKKVAFDRSGKLYHGRIKALAESARKEGLEF
jgi:large subunit ribosomal protein L18